MYEAQENHEETVVESQEETQETSNDNAETPQNEKPAGYYPVDISNLPEDIAKPIEERFDYLFKQIKQNERKGDSTLNQYRSLAAEQARVIEELTKGQSAIVDHLQDKTFKDTESQLTAKMNAAFEAGDSKGYQDAQAKLIELQVEKRFAKNKPVQQKPTQQTNPVQQAVQEGNLQPEEAYTIDAWQDESSNGVPLRPWAKIGHPDYERAYAETIAVLSNRNLQDKSMKEKLEEVDRRMGLKQNTGKQTVLGGNLTTNRKNNKLTISAEAQEIAIRTKYAGPGKSDSEHITAYLKQIQKTKSRRS